MSIATLDKRTSSTCRQHDNNIYSVADAEVGTNVPPLHPRCRSTIAGTLDKKATSGYRIGKIEKANKSEPMRYEKVPRNMDYDDWKAVYVDTSKTFDEWKQGARIEKILKHDARYYDGINIVDNHKSLSKIELMRLNYIPPSADFIKILAKERGMGYIIPRDSYHSDDGKPIWTPNDGGVGTPKIINLPVGTKIDRIGKESGRYTFPVGISYTKRSMDDLYTKLPIEYHVYKVIKPIKVSKSLISPWFSKRGKGVQYKLEMSIWELIKESYIEEMYVDEDWRPTKGFR
ncbi:glycohydrolase toxin TNT-related protein [Veillonella montpellierensis]|uniref:glycohydrolase toxin TNT-related protein n=1 Tax=Veillonella montpellierensis TaxID=187328 RepID=UPI0023F7F715|nr:glycohydrolase toxin TNT-related protein [Veillonella montpellierensis]